MTRLIAADQAKDLNASARPSGLRSRVLIATLACALALPPLAPAFAWGEKEQNALTGVAALAAAALLYRQYAQQQYPDPVMPQPQPLPQPTPRPVVQPASIYHTPVAHAFNRYSASERRMIQTNLARWGYYRGGIDGAFGPGTYGAVTTYARDSSETARLSTTTGAFAVLDGVLF